MHIEYEDCKYNTPTETETQVLAEKLGWSLKEYYDSMKPGLYTIEDRDKYIKEQRKSLLKV